MSGIAEPVDTSRPAATLREGVEGSPAPAGLAWALWTLLAALALARAALAFDGPMTAWGLNIGRFIDAVPFWTLWGIGALALVPAFARSWAARLDRLGDLLATAPAAHAGAALAGALLVFSLADRTWFEGDFLQRVGAARLPGAFAGNFTGALPLDYLLHAVLGGAISAAFGADATLGFRVFGALEAGLLAMLAVELVRLRGDRGVIALMVFCVAFFGGWLTMYTGLGKPASEMCLLTAVVGVMGASAARDGRGLPWVGVAMALALLTHRSGIFLAPAWLAALWLGWRHVPTAARRAAVVGGVILPVVVALVMARRIADVIAGYDVSHHLAAPEVARQGGMLAAAFAPFRLAELANLIVVMSPACLALPLVALVRPRMLVASREALFLTVLALGYLPVWVVVHPQQGVFRDWDVFAAAAVSLALPAAFALGETLRGLPRQRWLAVAITAAVTVSALQWLVHFHDAGRGLARVRAYATDTAPRPEWVHALAWDFLTIRNMSLGRWSEAADAGAHAVALGPHRRAVLQWGIAASMTGDEAQAARAYRMVLERAPDDPLAWLGLGGIALRTGDSTGTRRALERLERYAPESPEAREIRLHLRYFPEVWSGPLPANLARR